MSVVSCVRLRNANEVSDFNKEFLINMFSNLELVLYIFNYCKW